MVMMMMMIKSLPYVGTHLFYDSLYQNLVTVFHNDPVYKGLI